MARKEITKQLRDEHLDGRPIDDAAEPPAAAYAYGQDDEAGIGPNGICVALWPEDGRAAVTGGGDWEWGDYSPETETADDILAIYLVGDWEARN